MAAYETGMEDVFLRREMGGYEGNDVQREAVDGGERVPPFANSCQRDCGVVVKLGDLIQNGPTREVSKYSFPKAPQSAATYSGENAVRFSSSFKAKISCKRDRPFPG